MRSTVKTPLRTAAVAGMALAALFAGGAAATAAPAAFAPAPTTTASDVTAHGSGAGAEQAPAMAPDGTRIWF